MTKTSIKTMLALAIALGGFATAYGQYEVTGTTAGGGNVVVGSNLLGTVATGDGSNILSDGGSDKFTLTLGSFATTNSSLYGGTITFGTPNEIFINNGVIDGATNEAESDIEGGGVNFLSNNLLSNGTLGTDSITNETFINHGSIFGAQSGEDDVIGSAVTFFASQDINGVSITNTGLIEGV